MISIHASREGSDCSSLLLPTFSQISIHASREGSDRLDDWPHDDDNLFQSTLPAREATEVQERSLTAQMISIHASRGGSDGRCGKTGV